MQCPYRQLDIQNDVVCAGYDKLEHSSHHSHALPSPTVLQRLDALQSQVTHLDSTQLMRQS